MRRALAQTVLELASGVVGARHSGLEVSRLRLDLPIEVEMGGPDRLEFLADLPSWRWTTAFDPLRGRLKVNLEQGALE